MDTRPRFRPAAFWNFLAYHRRMRVLAYVLLAFCAGAAGADTVQEHVHQAAHGVMPFDMSKTLHVFAMTDHGGVQKVIVRNDGDAAQVALIQQHLQHEAEAFERGDFSDPGHLHGASMPGLADVAANASRIQVSYEALPNGAQISFETTDLHTITAIHRWFGAQLSEHGADARAE